MTTVPQGKVAQVSLPGRLGDGMMKPRPVVVIDDRRDYPAGATVEVVVVSHSANEPGGIYVPVPWHPAGHASTRLRKESHAAIRWVEHIPIEELDINKYGHVKISCLRKILTAIGKLEQD